MFINALAGPPADVRVRRAIAYAIDKNAIIEALLQGYAKPVNIVLTPANFGYVPDVKGYDYDPAKAKALLKEAGAEGASLTFLTSPAYDRRIVEALQQMIQDVGLKVEITTLDQPTFLRRRQGRPDEAGSLSIGRWSCACQDADGVIFPLFRSGGIWSKYSNPAFDAEVDAARAVLDESKRMAHYKKAFEILREDVPGIGLYQDYAIYGARRQLKWAPTPNEAMFIMDMSWSN
jgi:peptide/nickel transport system substrate-binding protein